MKRINARTGVAILVAALTMIAPNAAQAATCYKERQRSINPGETYNLTFKVKTNAICEYKYRTSGRRFTLQGISIVDKPASAVIKTNEYGFAFTFQKAGRYQLAYQVLTSAGPFTVNVAVEVVDQSF